RRPLVASGRQWRPGGHTYPRPVASSPMEASTMTSTPTRQSAPTRSSLDIGRAAQLRSIEDVAADMGIGPHLLEPYGTGVAKSDLGAIERLAQRPRAKYVVVSAITPTPLGEGKTTTTVGLGQGLNRTGRNATIAIRQASMGPTLGIKGGAAGGGHSQVVPMERLNLHLTGDMHAVTAAHNQLAAMLDNHLYRGNALNINPSSITWRRVLDVDDRVLRDIVVGLGPPANGLPRQTGFEITAASELMAALAGAASLRRLLPRMGAGGGRLHHRRSRTRHRRAARCRRSDDGAAARCPETEPATDPGEHAGAGALWPVRQYRHRQLLGGGRSHRYPQRRLPGHRGRFRCRYGRRTLLQPQVPHLRPGAGCGRGGGHGTGSAPA